MITLNITSITDEIFALTALRQAVADIPAYNADGGGKTSAIPAVLTRDNLPALRILVRPAFARIIARLIPYVADTTLEDGNPAASQPYDENAPVELSVDFGQYASNLSGGAMMVLKRYLEHLTALTVLENVYQTADTAQALIHRQGADAIFNAVETLLTAPGPASAPLTVTPSYY